MNKLENESAAADVVSVFDNDRVCVPGDNGGCGRLAKLVILLLALTLRDRERLLECDCPLSLLRRLESRT